MLSKLTFVTALALLLAVGHACAAEYEIVNHADLVFAEHDGTKLVGDLYLPKGRSKVPVLVAVHGGGWQVGSKQFYRYWGLFLARAGYAVFAVDYRLGKPGVYPAAVYDVKAAVQFIRAKAGEFDLDPDRIGLVGDSAGAHLASLVALAGDQFNSAYRDDATASVPANVKCVIGFYGVYDMHAQWTHDLTSRPNDKIVEKFLGTSPMQNRRVYFDASPISYATADHNQLRLSPDPRHRRRHRRLADPVGRIPDRADPVRVFRAPHHHPRRRAFLVVRSVRERATQLRRAVNSTADAVSRNFALSKRSPD